MINLPLIVSLLLIATEATTQCPTEIIRETIGTPDPVYSTYQTTSRVVTPADCGWMPPPPTVKPTIPPSTVKPTIPPSTVKPTSTVTTTPPAPPTLSPPTTSIHPHPTYPPTTTACPTEIIYDTVGTPDPVYSTYETTSYIITPYCPSDTPMPPTPPTAQGPYPTPECPTMIVHDTVGTPDPVHSTYQTTSSVVTPADCGWMPPVGSSTIHPHPPPSTPTPPVGTPPHVPPTLPPQGSPNPPTTACPTEIIYDTVGTPDPVYSTYETTSYIITPYCPSDEPTPSPKPPCSRMVNGRCLPPTAEPTTTAPPPIVCSRAANGRCLPPTQPTPPPVLCSGGHNRLRGSERGN